MASTVRIDTSRTNKARIAMGAMGAVGLALLGAGVALDWEFLGMFWSGVLAVGALGGLAMSFKSGGFASADCPACGHTLELGAAGEDHLVRCDGCHAYVHGNQEITVVPDDHVAEGAVFLSPVNEDTLRWPRNAADQLACPLCDADAALAEVELADVSAGAAIGVGGKVTTYKMQVPQCPTHEDGVALTKDWDAEDQPLRLAFRSRASQLRYDELNHA